jgi:hypothetical protein
MSKPYAVWPVAANRCVKIVAMTGVAANHATAVVVKALKTKAVTTCAVTVLQAQHHVVKTDHAKMGDPCSSSHAKIAKAVGPTTGVSTTTTARAQIGAHQAVVSINRNSLLPHVAVHKHAALTWPTATLITTLTPPPSPTR